mgnify:FL=1
MAKRLRKEADSNKNHRKEAKQAEEQEQIEEPANRVIGVIRQDDTTGQGRERGRGRGK